MNKHPYILSIVKKDYFVLLMAVSLYLLLFIYSMEGPGFVFEELDEAKTTASWLFNSGDSFVDLLKQIKISNFPLMINPYVGTLEMYLYIPFFKLFGVHIVSIRVLSILMGVLTICFTYFVVKGLFNRTIAGIVLFILVTQTSFVLFTKMAFSDSILNLFSVLSAFLLLKYKNTAKNMYLFWACFVMGVALWTKLVFILYIAGVAAGLAIFYYRRLYKAIAGGYREIITGFVAGVCPLIAANVKEEYMTFKKIFVSVTNPIISDSMITADNTAFVSNLVLRVRQFVELSGGEVRDVFYPCRDIIGINYYPYAILISLIMLAVYMKTNKEKAGNAGLVLFVSSFMFIGLCFTFSVYRHKHLFFMTPLPQILSALSIYCSAAIFYKYLHNKVRIVLSMPAVFLTLGLSAAVLCQNVYAIGWYMSDKCCLYHEYQNNVDYEVSEYLLLNNITNVYRLDEYHHLGVKIWFVSGGKVHFTALFDEKYELNKDTPGSFYLLTFKNSKVSDDVRSELSYKNWNRIKNEYKVELKEAFNDPRGCPLFYLYYVKSKK